MQRGNIDEPYLVSAKAETVCMYKRGNDALASDSRVNVPQRSSSYGNQEQQRTGGYQAVSSYRFVKP